MPDDVGVVNVDSGQEFVMEVMLSESSMEDVTLFAEEVLENMDVPIKQAHRSMIVLDEICSNIFNYSQANGFKTSIRRSEDDVVFTFTDDGVEFDPLSVEEVDISESADRRDEGGLGILLSKTLSKSIGYERINDRNVITVVMAPQ